MAGLKMLSPYFMGLIEKSLNAITEIPEETSMVVDDQKVFDILKSDT